MDKSTEYLTQHRYRKQQWWWGVHSGLFQFIIKLQWNASMIPLFLCFAKLMPKTQKKTKKQAHQKSEWSKNKNKVHLPFSRIPYQKSISFPCVPRNSMIFVVVVVVALIPKIVKRVYMCVSARVRYYLLLNENKNCSIS